MLPSKLSVVWFVVALTMFGAIAVPESNAQDTKTDSQNKSAADKNDSKDAAKTEPKSAEKTTDDSETTDNIEKLVAKVGKSVVVVSFSGRDGKQQGLGTGFIVSADGLIATNLHVIGEARPISVKLADGRKFVVTSIHATERLTDLALLRIDAKDLPVLELGNSDKLEKGEAVVAIGNPLGLRHSVVRGVVSGRRKIDGKPMIQLAIPIERGNSGGPLLDMQGRVHGIITLKSRVTQNLGFAVEINSLKPLLEKPNPIPMSRWLTIGALDPKEWTTVFGARWRQRAGRIQVSGRGQGFGGRSLCLSTAKTPDVPFEVAVTVRLGDEAGAAGLVVYSNGDDKHYGFYPSNGQIRFSRFDGPDVFSWQVLRQFRSPYYKKGEWNRIKIRVEKDVFKCFVNDELVVELRDTHYTEGKVGLAKFRETEAEFKSFQVAKSIPSVKPSSETVTQITKIVESISTNRPPKKELVDSLLPHVAGSAVVLHERADQLEKQAERLRQLAAAVHQARVRKQLAKLLEQDDDKVDLLHAALLISSLDNEELNIDAYRKQIDRMLGELSASLPKDADERAKLKALDKHLFQELGFHGSRTNYHSQSNSYLNEVIDDREGLPITLSVLYMEMARRLGLKVVGVGLPGHFVVRFEPKKGEGQLIDVFEEGRRLTRQEAADRVKATTNRELTDEFLEATTKRAIIVRMLRNLMGNARDDSDSEAMLRYVDAIVAVDATANQERWFRAVLRFQTNRIEEALDDTKWLLEKQPDNVDLTRVRELQQILRDAQR